MAEAEKPGSPEGGPTDWRALAARLAAVGSIAGEAAHRFNNLRAVIAGTLELLETDPAGLRLAQRLERIKAAAARAQALAEGLVAVANSGKGGGESRIDLAHWLDTARPWLTDLLGEGRALAIEHPETPVPLLCDERELRAALTALVVNAATSLRPAGKVRIRLDRIALDWHRRASQERVNPLDQTKKSVFSQPEDALERRPLAARGTVLLSVADDGAGMPPEVANRAREPFFTTRPGAAGLGLTVAEAFASRNGGRLELASAPGRGTVVSLWLAAAESAPP